MANYMKFRINGFGRFSGEYILGHADGCGAWYLCICDNETGLIKREYNKNFATLGYFDMQAALEGAKRATRCCREMFDFDNVHFE